MIRIAIVENIAEQKQTPSAQKGVIEYCMQPQKTQADERTIYVSGVNCVPEFANESFLATQNLYGHEPDGVRFYHYVQSFSPSENVTPELAHRIALELASYFGNREVLVATHLDSDHLHSHFVIDSYDIDSGKKLHMNKFTLADLRNQSDALCMKYGLSVLPQYDPKVKSTNLRPREYRAAMKGESWKMRLCGEIDEVMRYARAENEFKKLMRRRGYGVIWEPGRKYITYVVGENKRVRDIRLHETKYEKRCMEYEFRIRENFLASLKQKNPPPESVQLQTEQSKMVQLSAEEWERLMTLLSNLQTLDSSEWAAENALAETQKVMETATDKYLRKLKEQTSEMEKAVQRMENSCREQVGNLSEKFSSLLEGQQYRNEIKGVILFTVGMLALVSVLCLTILRGLGVI